MRLSILATCLLSLTACTPKTDPDDTATDADTDTDTDADADTDTDTDTDTDADTDRPDEHGFDFDGAWYPLVDGSMFCQVTGAYYTFSSGALREGDGPQANGYTYFDEPPTPGSYTVAYFDLSTTQEIVAGTASVGFLDMRDSSFWFSDGTAGTLEVFDAGGGALDVIWHNVALHNGTTGGRTTVEGWMNCAP